MFAFIRPLAILLFVLITLSNSLFSQVKVFDISMKKDMPIMGVGMGLSALGIVLRSTVQAPSLAEIRLLSPQDISAFDRGPPTIFPPPHRR